MTSSSRTLRWWLSHLICRSHRLPYSYLNSQKDCRLHAIKVLHSVALPQSTLSLYCSPPVWDIQWLTDFRGKWALTDFFWETLLASISVRRTQCLQGLWHAGTNTGSYRKPPGRKRRTPWASTCPWQPLWAAGKPTPQTTLLPGMWDAIHQGVRTCNVTAYKDARPKWKRSTGCSF